MPRPIRLNAFDMNCVAHQSPGLWRHPEDRAWDYRKLSYWTDLAHRGSRGVSHAHRPVGRQTFQDKHSNPALHQRT